MNPVFRNLWLRRIVFALLFVLVGVLLSFGVLVTWLATYPDDVDPKNIYYVLWKHGLNNNMNIDSALVAMSHDVWSEKRVQGLTTDQLKTRFGDIRTLEQASPYLRGCQGENKDVAFLRDSPWMVVMKNGKAVNLILCKGY
jgi:hypothetical protein